MNEVGGGDGGGGGGDGGGDVTARWGSGGERSVLTGAAQTELLLQRGRYHDD